MDHSESSAKLLIHLGLHFASFSEYTLISLRVLPDFDSTIRRFESSRPSQAVRRLETLPSVTSEMPANGGLLRIGYRSPGSQIGRCRREIADSLRRIFEIFPFLGDRDRRPGFDRHCVAGQENGGQPDLQDIRYGSFGGAGNFTTVPVPIGARNFVDRTPRCHKGA